MTRRERFLAACRCRPVDRTPVWVMRQAGRYLPEYRELKKRYSFLQLAQTPELAAEVTLQPLRRFDLDAAITFSDILVIPEALGQPYRFKQQGGIAMEYRIDGPARIDKLDPAGIPSKLAYVAEAQKLIRRELGETVALLGFGGSPWTLAAYMVEGGSSTHFTAIKNLYLNERAQFEALMEKISAALIDYFHMQIEAGVDALQIFDSWGGVCPDEAYAGMSLRWIKRIVAELPEATPVILYPRGMAHHAGSLIDTGAQVLSVDETVDLGGYSRGIAPEIAVQGNLDPAVMDETPEKVRTETMKILDAMRGRHGHIFNLGHGIHPAANPENLEILVDTVHRCSSTG